MTDDDSLRRGTVLLEQGRPEIAEGFLRRAVAEAPGDPVPLALLALCLVERKQARDAQQAAEEAIRLDPGLAFAHYVRGRALAARNDLNAALAAYGEAVRLDPSDPDPFAAMAGVRIGQRKWQEAIALADEALRRDPRHEGGRNARALALTLSGRAAEGEAESGRALSDDPESPLGHANAGWAALRRGDALSAMRAFREALRREPDLELARLGLVEAMKGRNPLYALLLRWDFWIGSLSWRAQLVVLFGFGFVFRLVRTTFAHVEALQSLLLPFLVVYFGFILLLWTARPMANLILRLDAFGRQVLSPDERLQSTIIGLLLLAGLPLVGLAIVTERDAITFLGAGLLTLAPAATSALDVRDGWPRWLLGLLAITLIGPLTIAVAQAARAGSTGLGGPGVDAFLVVLLGAGATSWLAMLLRVRYPAE